MNESTSSLGRVLIITGDHEIQGALRRVLEPVGLSVQAAVTPTEGLRCAREGRFDLVLLDWAMPDARGEETLAAIHEVDADIVCIVIAERVTVELAIQALRAGAFDVVPKTSPDERTIPTNRWVAAAVQGLEQRRLAQEARRRHTLEQAAAETARARAESERTEQFKTGFVRMAAHEMRAPIAAIQTLLTTLLKGYATPEQQQDFLQRAIDRAQDLMNMVDDLVHLSALAAEPRTRPYERVSLADVLEQVFSSFKIEAEKKGVTCTLEIRQRPLVKAYSDQMSLVWVNLISNAIKYTPAGGQVRMRVEEIGQEAVGTVEDTGIGIAAEYQARIFDEFFRTPQARQTSPRGTGLGLTLVKRILEAHNGTIQVESSPGKGSRFTFRLPLEGSPENVTGDE